MKKIICVFSIISLLACSKSKDPLSTDNLISVFQLVINGDMVSGSINQNNNTIEFEVADAELSSLRPTITFSDGATINPSPNTPQNFNQTVKYSVIAENGNSRLYTISIKNKISSSENQITQFILPISGENILGQIDQENNTITFNVVGADLGLLAPTIVISENANISPSSSDSLNFNEPVEYTVTAENDETRTYTIIVNNRALNTESKILVFTIGLNGENIEARIDNDLKEISFETGSFNISRLVPELVISENATVTPSSDEPVDFTLPVTYSVTAENGDVSKYTVVVNKAYNILNSTMLGGRTGGQLIYTRANLFVTTSFLDPRLTGAELYLFDGTNEIELPILEVVPGESRRILTYNITTQIPANTITSNSYRIGYRLGDFIYEASPNPDQNIDILAEESPRIISVNQDLYSLGDTLIVTGENLTDLIGVPSNGSFYLFNPFGRINSELNPEKTEYKLELEGPSSFANTAFFFYGGKTRDVIFIGPNRRLGHQITVTVGE
jgi:hypothetical protein